MADEDVIEWLSKAKDLLLEDGWVQGHLGNRRDGVCLIGSIHTCLNSALSDKDFLYRGDASRQARQVIEDVLVEKHGDELRRAADETSLVVPAYWNDYRATNVGQVVDVLDQAIIHVKEQSQPDQ